MVTINTDTAAIDGVPNQLRDANFSKPIFLANIGIPCFYSNPLDSSKFVTPQSSVYLPTLAIFSAIPSYPAIVAYTLKPTLETSSYSLHIQRLHHS